MTKFIFALFVVITTATLANAAGLEYKGDGQKLRVVNSAGSAYSELKSDGTLDLDGEVLSKTRLTGIETDVTNLETFQSSIEASLSGGALDIRIGAIEDDVTALETGKMDLVSSPTVDRVLKMDAAGQAVDAGFTAANVFLADGTNDMDADLNMASHKVINLADGVNANDAVNKGQLDAAIAGLSWKQPVDEAEVNSAALTGSVVAGYRVLVNGTGAGDFAGQDYKIATRNSTNDAWVFEAAGSSWAVFEKEFDQGWTFDGAAWVQFTGTGQIAAGDALAKTGNTLNVKYNDTTIGLNGSNQLEIKATSIGNSLIAADAAIAESKLSLDYSTSGLNSAITGHTGDATIHRSINDAGTGLTDLWSASKISTELSGKAASVHTHVATDVTDFTSAARGAISVSGGLLGYADGVISLSNSSIDHDALTNFVAAEHTPLNDAATTESNLWSASYTNDQIIAAVAAASPTNKLTIGGDAKGEEIIIGTTDGYDFTLQAGGVDYLTLAYDATVPTLQISVPVISAANYQSLKSGRATDFAGDKINIAENTDVAFAAIDLNASSSVVVRVVMSAYVNDGAAVDGGEWLITIRRDATNNVAVSLPQQVALFDGGAQDAATADIILAGLTAVAVDADTVALRVNAEITGTTPVTQYGMDYKLEMVGRGVVGFTNL